MKPIRDVRFKQLGLGLRRVRRSAASAPPPVSNPPVIVTAPVITGGDTVGSILTCTPGTWTNSPTTRDYQWTSNNVNIPGFTALTYQLQATNVGATIKCVESAHNADGTGISASNGIVARASFNPAVDVANIWAWYDVSDLATLTPPGPAADGTHITALADKSGNNISISVANPANDYATFINNSLGGKPGLQWLTVPKFYNAAAAFGTGPFTFYFVCTLATAAPNNARLLVLAPAGLADTDPSTIRISRTSLTANVGFILGGANSGSLTTVLDVPFQAMFQADGVNSNIEKDGANPNSRAAVFTWIADRLGWGIQLNATSTSGTAVWGGYQYELIMYKGYHDLTTRQKMAGYLAWKWGLVGALPAGHPYKAAPP